MKIIVVWQQGTKITYKYFPELPSHECTDKIGKEKGYGQTVLIGFSLPFRKRLAKGVNDLVAGLRYKYPICCILNFSLDTLLNRPAAQLRYSNRTEYVQCFIHIKRHDRKAIPFDLY